MNRDPFEVLDLRAGATLEDVHAAYIKLAKLVHPDRFAQDPPSLQDEAARRMTELNVAYEEAVATFGEDARAASLGPSVCARCEPPTPGATSFRCARCGSWWDATTCVRCGAAGSTTGGAGALYHCRTCAYDVHPPACSVCQNPMTRAGTCAQCESVLQERMCTYCGAPSLVEDATAALTCKACRQVNLRIA